MGQVKRPLRESFYLNLFVNAGMGRSCNSFGLTLVLTIALPSLSSMMVNPAGVQSIPKPSVPEFTLQLISSSPESNAANKTIESTI